MNRHVNVSLFSGFADNGADAFLQRAYSRKTRVFLALNGTGLLGQVTVAETVDEPGQDNGAVNIKGVDRP